MINHDRLFKELISVFFIEFLELFLPSVRSFVEASSVEFLDKEVFLDVTSGQRLEPDLVAKVKFKGSSAFFIIHVESQAEAQSDFGRRIFRYFSALFDKYGMPVYPIVIFSFNSPRQPQPDRFQVRFPNRVVLDFQYDVIQLNRLDWREFINKPNPVASALMAKMNIAAEDRVRVKWECLRLLVTLKLNRAKSKLISGFIDTYLRLDDKEQADFDQKIDSLGVEKTERIMEIVTSWMEEGIKRGRKEGLERGLQRGLQKGRREGLQEGRREGHLAGLQEGEIRAAQDDIVDVLETRFAKISVAVKKRIKTVEDREALKELLRAAAKASTLAEFRKELAAR